MSSDGSAGGPSGGPTSLSHRQILTVIGGLMVGMFIAAIDQTIVATAIPAIVSDLGGISYLSWIVVAYLLTSTAATPLWGKVGDLFGRRRMFQTAIVVFLVGSLMCGLAPSMLALIVRAAGPGRRRRRPVRAVLRHRRRPRAAPPAGEVHQLLRRHVRRRPASSGPCVGGVITDSIGWRWIFTINVPIGLASLVVTTLTLHLPSTRREAKVDLLGAALLVVGVTCLVLATAWGGDEYAWGSLQILGLSVGRRRCCSASFVACELRAEEPILPLRLFRNHVVAVLLGLSFLLGPIFFAMATFIPLFMQGVKGFTGHPVGPDAGAQHGRASASRRSSPAASPPAPGATSTGCCSARALPSIVVLLALAGRLDAGWSTWMVAGRCC